MRYEIREQPNGVNLLYRHGQLAIPDDGLPNNSTLEFWFEIKSLRKKLELRTIALQHACGLAQKAVTPSWDSLNRWRVALGWHELPADFKCK